MTSTKIWNKLATNVDINLDNVIVTYKTSARILLSIVEFLSYNRNQIPLVYETFKHMVGNLEKCSSRKQDAEIDVKDFAIERQRDLAIRTNRKFQEMSDIFIKSFKTFEIEQAVIVFGATIFTAKEAFVVNLPHITRNHLPDNHVDSPQLITRKVIMSIIASTHFFDVNCNELKPTNMFVFLKPKYIAELKLANIDDDQFKRHEHFKLPAMCRVTMLNIENDSTKMVANCCEDLFVFDDLNLLNSSDGNDKTDQNETEKIDENMKTLNSRLSTPNERKTNSCFTREIRCTTSVQNGSDDSDTIAYFYECKVSVKGFKDQLIKGKSIWVP